MQLPHLGLGVVYIPGLEPLLESGNTCIDVLEIEPQTLWNFDSAARNPYVMPAETLSHLRRFDQQKIIHSVGFAPGGTQQNSNEFVDALCNTIEDLDSPWVSEHLSITWVKSGQQDFHTGFMLPPLQTPNGARIASRNIAALGRRLPVPLAVETTVNYLKPRRGEMADGEFVAMVTEESNCGILLDLHNIWTNERNGRQTVEAFLASIPLERVWELHLAGGFEMDNYWLDAHSGAVPDHVMELARQLAPDLPNLKAVIYEIFPSFLPIFGLDAVQSQLEKIRDKIPMPEPGTVPASEQTPKRPPCLEIKARKYDEIDAGDWEAALGDLIINGKAKSALGEELEGDAAIPLIRKLIWKFRAGAIIKALNILVELIRIDSGDDVLEELLDGYFAETPPQPFASEEALGFMRYLESKGPAIPYIQGVIAYEKCVLKAILKNENQYAPFDYDPRDLIEALAHGKLPDKMEAGRFELEVTP